MTEKQEERRIFRKRLKIALRRIGKTQEWLANEIELGGGQGTVARWLRNTEPTEPKAETLRKICKALNVSSDYLLGLSDVEFPDSLKCLLTGNEYQKLAMRTCSIPYDDQKGRLHHAVFGLTSEAGEVAGILQKVYQGHEFDKEHIKKELGDCLWMIAEACEALDLDMNDVMQTNIDKLKARYPEGFSADRSLHRQEGDI